jgi:hypothetical protein
MKMHHQRKCAPSPYPRKMSPPNSCTTPNSLSYF